MGSISPEVAKAAGNLADNIQYSAIISGLYVGVILVTEPDNLNPIAIRSIPGNEYAHTVQLSMLKHAKLLRNAECCAELARNSGRSAPALGEYLKTKKNRTPAAYGVPSETLPVAVARDEGLVATLYSPGQEANKLVAIVQEAGCEKSGRTSTSFLHVLADELSALIADQNQQGGGYVAAAIFGEPASAQVDPIFLQAVGFARPGGHKVVQAKIHATLVSRLPSGHPDTLNNRNLSPLQGAVPLEDCYKQRVVAVGGLYDPPEAPAGELDRLLIQAVAERFSISLLGTIPVRI